MVNWAGANEPSADTSKTIVSEVSVMSPGVTLIG